jgi:hypothetical protein
LDDLGSLAFLAKINSHVQKAIQCVKIYFLLRLYPYYVRPAYID